MKQQLNVNRKLSNCGSFTVIDIQLFFSNSRRIAQKYANFVSKREKIFIIRLNKPFCIVLSQFLCFLVST